MSGDDNNYPHSKGVKPGRNPHVVSLARKQTEAAVKRAIELMEQDKFPAVAMRAVEWLMDRAWGKAVQPVADGTDHPALELDLSGVSYKELAKYELTLAKLLSRSKLLSESETPIQADQYEQAMRETLDRGKLN